MSLGAFSEAREQLTQALDLAQAIGKPRLQALVLRNIGALASTLGELSQAKDAYERSLALCVEQGDRSGEAAVYNNLGLLLWAQGHNDTAVTYLEQAREAYTEMGNRRNEGFVLLNLGRIYREHRDYASSAAHMEQALEIALRTSDVQTEGWVRLNLGRTVLLKDAVEQAEVHLQRALSIFETIGVPTGKATALANLADVARRRGEFEEAIRLLEASLAISRETGYRQLECWASHYMTDVLIDLGDYEPAMNWLERTLDIAREIGDERAEGWAMADKSLLLHLGADYDGAIVQARRVLEIGEALDQLHLRGFGLLRLGHALASSGSTFEASQAYDECLRLMWEIGDAKLALRPLAGLADLALAEDRPDRARQLAEEILEHLEEHSLEGLEGAMEVALACARALRAKGDPRADKLLSEAHDLLRSRAVGINDEVLRRSYLEKVATHRQLLTLHQAWQTSARMLAAEEVANGAEDVQKITVFLPHLDAPLGRPLRDEEHVSVTWTLSTLEDDSVSGKVARRRQRILRLLREAQTQGAAPTHDHLADALGVSRRTIERDMAALQRQDPSRVLPTRGKKSE
jgi:tetratricopeptide (TPR) repeat protein